MMRACAILSAGGSVGDRDKDDGRSNERMGRSFGDNVRLMESWMGIRELGVRSE
jgi:hypothetical protein